MRENPCRECVAPKRHPGCHATCEEYLKWRKEHEEEVAFIRNKRHQRGIGWLGEHYKHPSQRKKDE